MISNTNNYCSVVILAGGASRRMGRPKALLPFSDRETFLDHILAVYSQAGCQSGVVVLHRSIDRASLPQPTVGKMKIAYIYNVDPDADRMTSVKRGLSAVEDDLFVFIQDVDRPFVEDNVISQLFDRRVEDGFVAIDIDGHAGHPILLSPQMTSELCQSFSGVTLRDALKKFPCTLVPITNTRCDINVNTPEVYEEHFRATMQSL